MKFLTGHERKHYEAYLQTDRSKMILRDYLAFDRTILANQRTFLAYIRTALTLFLAGVTFIKFFEIFIIEIIGWIFVPIGVITFLVGLLRYNKKRVILDRIITFRKQPSED